MFEVKRTIFFLFHYADAVIKMTTLKCAFVLLPLIVNNLTLYCCILLFAARFCFDDDNLDNNEIRIPENAGQYQIRLRRDGTDRDKDVGKDYREWSI